MEMYRYVKKHRINLIAYTNYDRGTLVLILYMAESDLRGKKGEAKYDTICID